MTKYIGSIGYIVGTDETSPGVFEERLEERVHKGFVLRANQRWQQRSSVNDGLVVNHRISIVVDEELARQYSHIKYVTYQGVRWKVVSIDYQPPRVILSLGGVYNK